MRVLFVATSGAGHITPLVPLIDALVDAGDDVVVVSGPEARHVVEKTSARFEQAGVSQAEVMARLAARTRGGARHHPPVRADSPAGCSRARQRRRLPDLAGARSKRARMGRHVPRPDHSDLPPSLEVAEVPVGESMRLRPTVLPTAPPSTTERPLVYVTFGTLFNTNLDLFRLVLDALADEPIDVVATVGRDQDPAALLPHPANVRVERFVPQAHLLPTCSAIIHHGGAGTMFGALAHGVPQVILPQGADNFEHAAMCELAGVAVSLLPDVVDGPTLVEAVRLVLGR